MSFYGSSFSFDGRSCEEFGLMLYDFNSTTQGNSSFAKVDIVEDRLPLRDKSILYGSYHKDPLSFKLVFGVDEDTAAKHEDIDRQELELISSWLMGHSSYKWLSIDQPDMDGIRYRCILTDLEVLEHSGYKWAFQCNVHCDSPYAYRIPETRTFHVSGTSEVRLRSRSSANRPYKPQITISLPGGGDFSIACKEAGATFELKGVPSSAGAISLDGGNGILTCESGLNLYPYCNYKWPSLIRGDNHLTITGNGTVSFTCEFPVSVGG